MNRLRRWIRRLLRRPPPAEEFRITYESGGCRDCGEKTAVLDGRCWYCRTGNQPVKEPMAWSPDD